MATRTLQETCDQLLLLIRSGHPVICVRSHEEARVRHFFTKIMRVILAENPKKHFITWYEGAGTQALRKLQSLAELPADARAKVLRGERASDTTSSPQPGSDGEIDWLALPGESGNAHWETHAGNMTANDWLDSLRKHEFTTHAEASNTLAMFFDLHPYLTRDAVNVDRSLVRPLRNTAASLRNYYEQQRRAAGDSRDFRYNTIIIVTPFTEELSPELRRDIVVVDFPLPEQDELRITIEELAEKNVLKFTPAAEQNELASDQKQLCDLIAGAGRGLTLDAFRLGLNAFAVRHESLSATHIKSMHDLKANFISNVALQYTPQVDIHLGGLEPLKQWIKERSDLARYESLREQRGLEPLSGVVLSGVSGGGKSMAAKLIAKEFNLALLRLDVGALFGSYIGESERQTREALELAEVLAPIVLWLDEVEKAFTGMAAGGDNGVSARVFGAFLTWLADKQGSVFVVATANDLKRITDTFPEFGRKGRFDEIFFVNLPTEAGRREIFRQYLQKHFKSGFLAITENAVKRSYMHIKTSDPCEALCELLSDVAYSSSMTGAEIEHAIKESMHLIYSMPPHQRNEEQLVLEKIVQTVEKAKRQALYRNGSDAQIRLAAQLVEAGNNGWQVIE